MSDDRGFSFPLTAISVAALLVSATYLGHSLLDALRLNETDAVKVRQAEPSVEARLWEDPFAALARHVAKLKEACVATKSAGSLDARCESGQWGADKLPDHILGEAAEVTVIAALLPGARSVGVEESRRRIRYAVLAGLGSKDFVPDDGEHMRMLRVSICESFLWCEPEQRVGVAYNWLRALGAGKVSPTPAEKRHAFEIPYETLSAKTDTAKRVVIFWIDDTKIGERWLSSLVTLLRQTVDEPHERFQTVQQRARGKRAEVRLRIVGPYNSDKLAEALGDVSAIAKEAAALRPGERAAFLGNWKTLLGLQLVSPFATTTTGLLRMASQRSTRPSGAERDKSLDETACASAKDDCVSAQIMKKLWSILDYLPELDDPVGRHEFVPSPFFVRTIGPDIGLINLLMEELRARGLNGNGKRVILLHEWDSIYARTFADLLKAKLAEKGLPDSTLEVYSYLRGLDGATVDGAPKQQRLVPRSSDRDERKSKPEIEWPESRDQRDYVRRLVAGIEGIREARTDRAREARVPRTTLVRDANDEDKGRVVAVGMIGSDVHDKLILAQALRANFPDRMLFTTDLDARFMHSEVLKFTRNLVVASSLSLIPDAPPTIGIAPFRDSYQTATYRAVRYAASSAAKIPDEPVARLFEIGNDGAIELDIEHVSDHEANKRLSHAGAASIVLAALGLLMFLWKPAPAMRTALAGPDGTDAQLEGMDGAPRGYATAVLAGLQVAALGFALGVVIELAFPGAVGAARAVLIAAALTVLFWIVVYPGIRTGDAEGKCLVVAVVAFTLWLTLEPGTEGMREPLAPGGGISAWPSQLLRTLGVVLCAWFIDFSWNNSAIAARHIDNDFFGRQSGGRGARKFRFWKLTAEHSEGGFNGCKLWRSYRGLLDNRPRLLRVAAWVVLAFVGVWLEMELLGADVPEIPARGLDDRALFRITMYVLLIGTVILLVLVADATVQTWRIVAILKKGRTQFPATTVRSYWARLGVKVAEGALERSLERGAPPADTASQKVWQPIRAPFDKRDEAGTAKNSLLDDWIDARLLAEHTEKIGPLIVFPFVLIALLIVASSRLLDNWAPGGIVMVALATYLLWAVAVAAMLNVIAEIARRDAVSNMRADLRWMEGHGKPYVDLTKQFSGVIDDVINLRQGAFAPFFEQPLVRAVLVTLGGAGGVQLLEMIVLGR